MPSDDWKGRVEFLEARSWEQARECAAQHVALGQLLEILEGLRREGGEPRDGELIRRFEEVLEPYAQRRARFQMAAWALRDRAHLPAFIGEGL